MTLLKSSPTHDPCTVVRMALCLWLLAGSAIAMGSVITADLVLTGGRVYTAGMDRPSSLSVAVQDGHIVYVGADSAVEAYIGPRTHVIRLHGDLVLPSFQDSHAHPSLVPNPATRLNLDGLKDQASLFARIREFAARHPDSPWILGTGWDEAAFLPSGRPTRQMLDALLPDRPAFLVNNSQHQAWVNTAALRLAGITRDTANPQNGEIVRDAHGDATGNLQEMAMQLVRRVLPAPTLAERASDLESALAQMHTHGITSVVEAAADPATIEAYAELARSHRLHSRVRICQRFDPANPDDEAQIQSFIATRAHVMTPDLDANCVKVILDGGYGSRSVALLEPYLIPGLGSGRLFVEPTRLTALVTRLDALGFQLHVHAIGDRTVRTALDAVQAARHANPDNPQPHTLAHLALVHPTDISRFAALNVIANMTPLWSRPDPWQTVFAVEMFGAERADHGYPTRRLLNTGAGLAWGSDWPVTGMATLDGIETALTHRHLGGLDEQGQTDTPWNAQERLTLSEALAAYTTGGAALFRESGHRGTLEVGKDADLVVIDRNLFDLPPGEIHQARVEMTIRQGRILFDALTVDAPSH